MPTGFAAPIGSDEFVLLVPGLDDALALEWVVTRVGETLAVPFDIGLADPVEVSATAAGALWRPGDDPRSVFGVVDERVTVGKVYRREDGFGKLADLVAGVLDRAPGVELLDAAAGADDASRRSRPRARARRGGGGVRARPRSGRSGGDRLARG